MNTNTNTTTNNKKTLWKEAWCFAALSAVTLFPGCGETAAESAKKISKELNKNESVEIVINKKEKTPYQSCASSVLVCDKISEIIEEHNFLNDAYKSIRSEMLKKLEETENILRNSNLKEDIDDTIIHDTVSNLGELQELINSNSLSGISMTGKRASTNGIVGRTRSSLKFVMSRLQKAEANPDTNF